MMGLNFSEDLSMIRCTIDGGVAHIVLNRPEKRNALSLKLLNELQVVFSSLPDSVGIAVVSGNGSHFSAGLDLSELTETSAIDAIQVSLKWYEALEKIQFNRVPVIGVLHGAAIGGGLELAAAFHIRVAEEDAYFALPEAQHGIFLGGSGSVRITKLVGFSRMTDMMLTGRVLSAYEAERIGLIQYVAPKGDGLRLAFELANKIAANAKFSNYVVTNVLPIIAEQPMAHGLITEALVCSIAQSSHEAKQRMGHFLSKKKTKIAPSNPSNE